MAHALDCRPLLCQFIQDEPLAALEADLPLLSNVARFDALVALAWHVRQRDSTRALALAHEALQLLPLLDIGAAQARRATARLYLVQGEVKILFAALEEAERLLQSAAQLFESLGDAVGQGDAAWLLATLALDRGSMVDTFAALESARTYYARAADVDRLQACMARTLAYEAFRDAGAAAIRLQAQFPANFEYPAGVHTWVASAQANVAVLTDDMGRATGRCLEVFDAALQSGQVRQALVAVNNAGECFAKLGDLDAALLWSERALSVAHAAA